MTDLQKLQKLEEWLSSERQRLLESLMENIFEFDRDQMSTQKGAYDAVCEALQEIKYLFQS